MFFFCNTVQIHVKTFLLFGNIQDLDAKAQEKEDLESNLERAREKLETEVAHHTETKQRLAEIESRLQGTSLADLSEHNVGLIPPPPAPPMPVPVAPPPPPGPPPMPNLFSGTTHYPFFITCFLLLNITELELRNMSICHFQGLRRQLAWEAITLMVSLDPPYQHPQFAKMFPSLPTH